MELFYRREKKRKATAGTKNLSREEKTIMKKAKETKKMWKGWIDPTCTPIHVK